ncbi:MAG TPA: hypothetical protein VK427_06755, partial [Kofleriaceae bacterium]|nr:hypothetical protein [Kofleriaceae bacterium]
MDQLAARLRLDAVERDFVWTAVALAADPRLLVHAVALVGPEARRGLSLMLYGIVAGLPAEHGHALALRLTPSHPLVRWQFLEVAPTDANGCAVAYAAAGRLVQHLAGNDTVEPPLSIVSPPTRPVFDDAQER